MFVPATVPTAYACVDASANAAAATALKNRMQPPVSNQPAGVCLSGAGRPQSGRAVKVSLFAQPKRMISLKHTVGQLLCGGILVKYIRPFVSVFALCCRCTQVAVRTAECIALSPYVIAGAITALRSVLRWG